MLSQNQNYTVTDTGEIVGGKKVYAACVGLSNTVGSVEFDARITAQSGSTSVYSFVQVEDATAPGNWANVTGGITGASNAEEVNGNASVPAGTGNGAIVRMRKSATNGWYEFDYAKSSTPTQLEWIKPTASAISTITLASGTLKGYAAKISTQNTTTGVWSDGAVVWLNGVNAECPIVGQRYQCRHFADDKSGVQIWETALPTRVATLEIRSPLASSTLTVGTGTLTAYQADLVILDNASGQWAAQTGTVYFLGINGETPSAGVRYQCALVGQDGAGDLIWGGVSPAQTVTVTATAPIASTGGTTPNISHLASGVTAGSYTLLAATINATGHVTLAANGTAVTSVGLSLPTSVFTVTVSPVTTTGVLTAVFNNQTAHTFFAGPTNGTGVPTFRVIDVTDLPIVNPPSGDYTWLSAVVDDYGRVTEAAEGMPMTTLGDVVYMNATPAPARLAGNTTTGPRALVSTGNGTVAAAPSWQPYLLSVYNTYPNGLVDDEVLEIVGDSHGVVTFNPSQANQVTLVVAAASGTQYGIVTTAAQTFAGAKTFADDLYADNSMEVVIDLYLAGVASGLYFGTLAGGNTVAHIDSRPNDGNAGPDVSQYVVENVSENAFAGRATLTNTRVSGKVEYIIAAAGSSDYPRVVMYNGTDYEEGVSGTGNAGDIFVGGIYTGSDDPVWQVYIDAADTTPGYLKDKLPTAGDLAFAVQSPSGNETLKATVTGLQGVAVAATAPTSGQVLGYDGTNWKPTSSSGSSDHKVLSTATDTVPDYLLNKFDAFDINYNTFTDNGNTKVRMAVVGIEGYPIQPGTPSNYDLLSFVNNNWLYNNVTQLLKTLPGYSASANQALMNLSGTIQWVTVGAC